MTARGRPRRLRRTALALVLAGIALVTSAARAERGDALHVLAGNVPAVAETLAPVGSHRGSSVLRLDVGLAVRDAARLGAAGAGAPVRPSVTRAQYRALHAPTDASARALRSWLAEQGLTVLGTAPDNLWVRVEGTTAAIDRAFRVTIRDFRSHGRLVYANDRPPRVPAALGVDWISGLDDASLPTTTFAAAARRTATECQCYTPAAFRSAYGIPADWRGSGQTIGITMFGALPDDPKTGATIGDDLANFAAKTGTTPLSIGPGADQVDFVRVGGAGVDHGEDDRNDTEILMDIEEAHAVAPGAHIRLFLAASEDDLRDAVAAAAADPTVHVVSNSWGFNFAPPTIYDRNVDKTLQMAASVGTTFYFATGDDHTFTYPSDSAYAVGVGGTSLLSHVFGFDRAEVAWAKGGGGCVVGIPRPWWQSGAQVEANATCEGRATPDVSLDADPATGAVIWVDGAARAGFGTSLATPLLAGFTADWNAARAARHLPTVGFVAPLLYSLGNDAGSYGRDFHDITVGSSGISTAGPLPTVIPAGPGWDGATGWGSPNFTGLATETGTGSGSTPAPVVDDLNGDGTTDLAVYQPFSSWFGAPSLGAGRYFGSSGDIPVPADYASNRQTTIAVFKPATGTWVVSGGPTVTLGARGDIPVPADYDGEGRAVPAVYRPADATWLIEDSQPVSFGAPGAIPVPGDYDARGKAELAYYDPAGRTWNVRGDAPVTYGVPGAVPVPGDYDGDGHVDFAYYDPASETWHVHGVAETIVFGAPGAVPVPGDYDGDGRTDIAYYLPPKVRCRPGRTRPPTPVCTTLARAGWHVLFRSGAISFGSDPGSHPGLLPLQLPYAIYHRFFR